MNQIKRSAEEIREQESAASDAEYGEGCPFPGMSFSEGVRHALAWVLGDTDDAPMEDD